VAIFDSHSVKNTTTATSQIGINGGKRINGRKRTLLVDTMRHILGIKVGLQLWQQIQLLNPIVQEVKLVYADSTFGEKFKQEVQASKSTHHPFPHCRTTCWPCDGYR
jgi:putative transposase